VVRDGEVRTPLLPTRANEPFLSTKLFSRADTMKTIYKYPIAIIEEQEITMPQGAEVIHAGLDPQGNPCVWALVDTRNEPEPVSIVVYGTGNPVSYYPNEHVGSFNHGPFVWHVFLG